MTLAAPPTASSLKGAQHLVLDGVSWGLYEQLLQETSSQTLRITFDRGRLEAMSPRPEHEVAKKAAARLIELLAFVRGITLASFGSTTFRREDAGRGLEPDECYYIADAQRVAGMTEFDPHRDPPPEFVVEIDITRRSIDREPIYASLGVKEIWRFDGRKLRVLELSPGGAYQPRDGSKVFPFLPIDRFGNFMLRMMREPNVQQVLEDFAAWVRAL